MKVFSLFKKHKFDFMNFLRLLNIDFLFEQNFHIDLICKV